METTTLLAEDTAEQIKETNVEVLQRGRSVLEEANSIVVDSQESADYVSALVGKCKKLIAFAGELFDKDVGRAYSLHKSLVATRKMFLDPPTNARRIGANKVVAWQEAEKKKIRDAEKKERKRLEDEAKQDRLDEAAKLESAGEIEKAEEQLTAALDYKIPASVPVSANPAPIPKTAGIRPRTVHKAKVNDIRAFVSWALETKNFERYFTLNQTALNQEATRAKEHFALPGCEHFTETTGS